MDINGNTELFRLLKMAQYFSLSRYSPFTFELILAL